MFSKSSDKNPPTSLFGQNFNAGDCIKKIFGFSKLTSKQSLVASSNMKFCSPTSTENCDLGIMDSYTSPMVLNGQNSFAEVPPTSVYYPPTTDASCGKGYINSIFNTNYPITYVDRALLQKSDAVNFNMYQDNNMYNNLEYSYPECQGDYIAATHASREEYLQEQRSLYQYYTTLHNQKYNNCSSEMNSNIGPNCAADLANWEPQNYQNETPGEIREHQIHYSEDRDCSLNDSVIKQRLVIESKLNPNAEEWTGIKKMELNPEAKEWIPSKSFHVHAIFMTENPLSDKLAKDSPEKKEPGHNKYDIVNKLVGKLSFDDSSKVPQFELTEEKVEKCLFNEPEDEVDSEPVQTPKIESEGIKNYKTDMKDDSFERDEVMSRSCYPCDASISIISRSDISSENDSDDEDLRTSCASVLIAYDCASDDDCLSDSEDYCDENIEFEDESDDDISFGETDDNLEEAKPEKPASSFFFVPASDLSESEEEKDDDIDWECTNASSCTSNVIADNDWQFGSVLNKWNTLQCQSLMVCYLEKERKNSLTSSEKANMRWDTEIELNIAKSSGTKVRFNDDVRVEYAEKDVWRVGDWEIYARNSMRFRNRVEKLSKDLNPILSENHRQKIFHNRFETNISL